MGPCAMRLLCAVDSRVLELSGTGGENVKDSLLSLLGGRVLLETVS